MPYAPHQTPKQTPRGMSSLGSPSFGSRTDSILLPPGLNENSEEGKNKILDPQVMAEMAQLEDEQEVVNQKHRAYDPLPWWKRILLDPEYRAALIYEASKCYEEELRVLHYTPEELSSTQAMTHTAVMSQYVGLPANTPFSVRHPHLIIKHSKLETLRRVALNNMPPARDSAHHAVQKEAIEDYLIHRRRASLTRSRLAKRIRAQRIMAGKDPVPPLPISEVYNVPPPAESDAAFSDNLAVSTPPLSPLSEIKQMLIKTRQYKEEEEARRHQREERDVGGIPARMLPPPAGKSSGGSADGEGRPVTARKTSLDHTMPRSDMERMEALNAAKSCVDGMDNLYGLSYFWDLPLPPAGFIRCSPDPRHAMWPDDFREESRRRALEKRKADVEKKIQMVNEQNKRRRFYVELGLRVNPLQFLTLDEEDEEEDPEEAEHIRRKMREDGVLKPVYSGPLNINIFVEVPQRHKKPGGEEGAGGAADGSSRPSPSAAPPSGASPQLHLLATIQGARRMRGGGGGAGSGVGRKRTKEDPERDDNAAAQEEEEAKRSERPRMVLAGTYRQSLMLIHYKTYARALHREEDRRLRGSMARVGGQLDDDEEMRKRLEYHQKHSKRLADVPRFEFPVLRVQSASPPLKFKFSMKTVDTTNVPPAACWEGLFPSPSPDPTHPASNAWRHLQCTSLLARQAVQDTFNCLDHDPDGSLDKRTYVNFVLDLLHLFMPTYHRHIHVAIAEEEWVFRGTTENVRFETFFQKFFSFPFIFMRDISKVHEQEYVEFWSMVRVALFESQDTMPTLLPFVHKDKDFHVEGTITSSRTPEEARHLEVRVLWRREGMDFTRSIRLQQRAGFQQVVPLPPEPKAPTPPSSSTSTAEEERKAREKMEEKDRQRQEKEQETARRRKHRREKERHERQTLLLGAASDSSRSSTSSPPRDRRKDPDRDVMGPAITFSPVGSDPGPFRERRSSLLAPITDLKPNEVRQLYVSRFRHPEDYDLVLMSRHVAAEDPLIPHLPPSHREAVIRARAAELLEVCRTSDESLRRMHFKALEERQRQLDRVGADLTLTIAGGSQKDKLDAIREEVAKEMGGTTDSGNTMATTPPPVGGESRSAQVLRLERERRAVIERLERERQKSSLLRTSHRHHDRQRRIHAQYAKAISTVESMASAYELHYDDVFEMVQRPPDVEDGLIEYVADVEEDMFGRNVSLRERYLVHEAYKRDRQRILMSRNRARSQEMLQTDVPPTDLLKKQLERSADGPLQTIFAPYRENRDDDGDPLVLDFLEGSLSTLEKPDEPNRIPYPPRKLSMAPLMDPRVMEHLYLSAMASNPSTTDAITGCTDKFQSFVTGAYPLHPTEGKGPEGRSASQSPMRATPTTRHNNATASTGNAGASSGTLPQAPTAMQSSDSNLHVHTSAARRGGRTSPGSEEGDYFPVITAQPSVSSMSYRKVDEVFVSPLTLLSRERPQVSSTVYEAPPRHIRGRDDFGGLNVDGRAAQRHLYQVREEHIAQQLAEVSRAYRAQHEGRHFHTSRGGDGGTYATWSTGAGSSSGAGGHHPLDETLVDAGSTAAGSNPLELTGTTAGPFTPLSGLEGASNGGTMEGAARGVSSTYPPYPSHFRHQPGGMAEGECGAVGSLADDLSEDSIVGSIPILPSAERRKIAGIPETVVMTLRRMRREKPPPTPDFQRQQRGATSEEEEEEDDDDTDFNFEQEEEAYRRRKGVEEALDAGLAVTGPQPGAHLRRLVVHRGPGVATEYNLDPQRRPYPGRVPPFSRETIASYAPSTKEHLYGLAVLPKGCGTTKGALVMGGTMLAETLDPNRTCRFDESNRAIDGDTVLLRAIREELQREEEAAAVAPYLGTGGPAVSELLAWGSTFNASGTFDVAMQASAAARRIAAARAGAGADDGAGKLVRRPPRQGSFRVHPRALAGPSYSEAYLVELNLLLGIREEEETGRSRQHRPLFPVVDSPLRYGRSGSHQPGRSSAALSANFNTTNSTDYSVQGDIDAFQNENPPSSRSRPYLHLTPQHGSSPPGGGEGGSQGRHDSRQHSVMTQQPESSGGGDGPSRNASPDYLGDTLEQSPAAGGGRPPRSVSGGSYGGLGGVMPGPPLIIPVGSGVSHHGGRGPHGGAAGGDPSSSSSSSTAVPIGKLFRDRCGIHGLPQQQQQQEARLLIGPPPMPSPAGDATAVGYGVMPQQQRQPSPLVGSSSTAVMIGGRGRNRAKTGGLEDNDVDLRYRLQASRRWNDKYRNKFHPDAAKRFVNNVNSKTTYKAKVPTNLWARLSQSSGWTTSEGSFSGSGGGDRALSPRTASKAVHQLLHRMGDVGPSTSRCRPVGPSHSSRSSSASTSKLRLMDGTPSWAMETMQPLPPP